MSAARNRTETHGNRTAAWSVALLLALSAAPAGPAFCQPSVVTPGPAHTLAVNGAPFYPLGWTALGTCADRSTESTQPRRDSVAAHLSALRRYGVNTVLEPASSDGRLVARVAVPGRRYNWYGYHYASADGDTLEAGHTRPGAYVEGLRWLMDRAAGDTAGGAPIYTLVSLAGFAVPYSLDGHPYRGQDTLSCPAYAAFIAQERSVHAGTGRARRMPAVACAGQPARPFWEWNLRYVIHGLRDEPGLLGWYLWDEPEGVTWRHLFGVVAPHEAVPPYTGPTSLPTPDFLRYAYRLVRRFEEEGRPAGYRRHPIVVDLLSPHVFFSNRFAWSEDGALDAAWSSGPFDRLPEGGYQVPADVLGQEASALLAYTAARGPTPRLDWYWDPNFQSRAAERLAEVVARDTLWAALVIAGQAQLPSAGGYALAEPLRCEPNDELRARYLNDRDLVWQLLTSQINGLRGFIYYSHARMPATGPGAEQVCRSNRLLRQFLAAGLDRVFATPSLSSYEVTHIMVDVLTDYARSDPAFVGPADGYDPGLSAFSWQGKLTPEAYSAATFGRTDAPEAYGQPARVRDGRRSLAGHRLLRTASHRYQGQSYLFVSNAYDARIRAILALDGPSQRLHLEEGVFDLAPDGSYTWRPSPARAALRREADGHPARLEVALEPYEARVFRLRF